jgi:hypothetical protein
MSNDTAPPHRPAEAEETRPPAAPDPRICAWCANSLRDVCEPCQAEGRYRYLQPAPLPDWECPPELRRFRDLLEMPAVERLAWLYLAATY